MYSQLLNKNTYNSIETVEKVLYNLSDDTKTELLKIFGDNFVNEIFNLLSDKNVYLIRLKSNHEPVGLFGLIPLSDCTAGIYLLTTGNLHKGNIITFLKGAKKQIALWQKDYKLIMDNCYKQNKTIQKWLTLLGFQPSEYEDENFQIYYIGDIKLYE